MFNLLLFNSVVYTLSALQMPSHVVVFYVNLGRFQFQVGRIGIIPT